jgi:alkylhydroperoxidase family enzyme
MRIPPWTPELKPQPEDLVAAIQARRQRHTAWRSGDGDGNDNTSAGNSKTTTSSSQGRLLALDRALLWSAPLARGWNAFVGAVRSGFDPQHRKLREFAICCVALLIESDYEYGHHAPDFLAAGGTEEELQRLRAFCAGFAAAAAKPGGGGVAERDGHDSTATAAADHLPRDLALAARLAAQMTATPPRVDGALVAELRDLLGTDGLVELAAAAATYNMVGRLLVTLDIQPKDDGGSGHGS